MGYRNHKPDIQLTGVNHGPRGKALLFQADYWDEPQFLPASCCSFEPEEGADEKGRGVMTIAGWLAAKNGWDEI